MHDPSPETPIHATLLCPEADAERIAELRGAGAHVVDTLATQHRALVRSRNARLKRSEAEQLAETIPLPPSRFAYYPWRHTLVRVLREDDLFELRTSRNHHKITVAEQRILRDQKLAIAGLSVGSSTALTLIQEGIGSVVHLADFDVLELTNLNRLRANLLDLGLPKTVITARAIAELDPYVEVRTFDQGVLEENLDAFLDGVSLLFEECDDLAMKLRLREVARSKRIPVLMETSDRGMLDVERFDLEPDRPVLHGLVGSLRSQDLVGLTTYEKVPTVLRIIGAETLSERMGASLVDIDTTLTTWPQLASAVALGGALNTEAARRILLGQMTHSGRFYADLRTILEGSGTLEVPAPTPPIEPAGQLPSTPLIAAVRSAPPTEEQLESLIAFSTLAPSGGNAQPWQFEWSSPHLDVRLHAVRGVSLLDHERRASVLAIGAVLEYLERAARASGWETDVGLWPEPGLVARVTFRASAPDPDSMRIADVLRARRTDRRRGRPDAFDALDAIAHAAPGLTIVERSGDALEAVAELLADGDRLRFLSGPLCAELLSEVRWSAEEARRTRDGLDLASLEMTPTDVAGLRLLRRSDVLAVMKRLDIGRGLGKATRESVEAASTVLLLRATGASLRDMLEGGRALATVWSELNRLGWAVQPMTALPYLLARFRAGGDGLGSWERSELRSLDERYRAIFGDHAGADLMLLRVARSADGLPTRSLRLRPHEVWSETVSAQSAE